MSLQYLRPGICDDRVDFGTFVLVGQLRLRLTISLLSVQNVLLDHLPSSTGQMHLVPSHVWPYRGG